MKLPFLAIVLSLAFLSACKPTADVQVADGGDPNEILPYRSDDKKWGFHTRGGKVLVEPKYENVSPFQEDAAKVKLGGNYGYIDKTGKVLIEPKYAAAGNFSEGLASVQVDGKFGFIDKTGKIVIAAKYETADRFNDGFATVTLDGKAGYIDKKEVFKEGDAPGTLVEGD